MRFFPNTLLHTAALLAALLITAVCGSAETKPRNMVFILIDDQRFDSLGILGHPFLETPNIDSLAKGGILFENAFVTTSLCSPSRASYLSGQYAHTHGVLDNSTPLPVDTPTFPQELQKGGYKTAFVGKWHMGVDDSPRPGFDYWFSLQGQGYYFDPDVNENGRRFKAEGYTTDLFNERAVRFVRQERDRPFLLVVAHKAVHPNIFQNADGSVTDFGGAENFTPAPRHAELYADREIPRRPNAASYGKDKPALQRPIEGVEPLGPTTGTDDAVIRNRLRMLAAADEGLGQLLAALEETGQLDNTVVIATSDHGYFYGEHGLDRERRLAYEEAIRVPLLVRYPPLVKAGAEIDAMVTSVDLAPTILQLTGTAIPADLHGRSLVPLLQGQQPTDWRRSVLIEYFSDKVMARIANMGYKAARTERWKYIQYTELDGMNELYDLENDPYEMHNLAADPASAKALAEMKAELETLIKQTGPVRF